MVRRRESGRKQPAPYEEQLRKLFGIESYVVMYERYRTVLGGPLCGAAPPGMRARTARN